jgi:hypothetical protein
VSIKVHQPMEGQTKVQPMAEQIAIQPMVKKHCTVQSTKRLVTVIQWQNRKQSNQC